MCLCLLWCPISPSFLSCAHNVWCSCSPTFLCCECDVLCSYSPSFLWCECGVWCSCSLSCFLCCKHDEGYVFKSAADTIKISHDWRVEMPAPWEWRMTRRNETRETSLLIETERLWRVPRQVEKELRNQCRCMLRQEVTGGLASAAPQVCYQSCCAMPIGGARQRQ